MVKSKQKESDWAYELNSNIHNTVNSDVPSLIETVVNFEKGTILQICGIFHESRIRKFDFSQNAKMYHSKVVELINHYSVVYPSVEFRLICSFSDGRHSQFYRKPSFLFETDNLKHVLGTKLASSLKQFSSVFDDFKFRGYLMDIFKEGIQNESNQVYMSINQRPINAIASIVKIIKNKIISFNLRKKYFLILNIDVPYSKIDISYDKSKMNVKFQNENQVLDFLKSIFEPMLDEFYDSIKVIQKTTDLKKLIEFNSIGFNKKKSGFKGNESNEEMIAPLKNSLVEEIEEINNEIAEINSKDEIANSEVTSSAQLPPDHTKLSKHFVKLRNFEKSQIKDFEIIGQFNKGFIITKLKEKCNSFFVVDQHASDEKASYESFVNNYTLQNQKLAFPIKIRLSLYEMHLIEKNETFFEQNKFTILKNVANNSVELISVPQYKNITFGENEFFELLRSLKEGDRITDFIFSKLKTELASNACRKSIMIGQKLNMMQMQTIIANLSELKAPFNCPHGRPTLFQLGFEIDDTKTQRMINDYLYEC